MQKGILLLVAIIMITACTTKKSENKMSSISEKTIVQTIDSVLSKSNIADTSLISKGIRNAAGFWNSSDGSEIEFMDFCIENFANTEADKAKLFESVQRNLEIIYGNYNKISLGLKEPVQIVGDDYTKIDEDFGAMDPYAHFADDMFNSKIAFKILLNFPFYTLEEKNNNGEKWTRTDWAYARLGDLFTSRIPAELNQALALELAKTENYISNYNIKMDMLRSEDGRKLFSDGMTLISHWGLRDELKANYADKNNGFEKQAMIYVVMKHIINQTIPAVVINNNGVNWKPVSNKVLEGNKVIAGEPEANVRYERLLAAFNAMKNLDTFCKSYPTAIHRAFDRDMEVSAENIEKIFTDLVSSAQVEEVAGLIKKRLGRDLMPFDIWYDGFKSRSSIPEDEMSAKTRKLYPDTKSFEKAMPGILINMGFPVDDAAFIGSKIVVDNSRGSGHAWGAQTKTDVAHLRTRLQPGGMDYKGYNIALHEFGHNVEQTISLNNVDNYIMNGIPSTAFTEALAFVFQKRDLELLGYKSDDKSRMAMQTLDIFWGCYEIMGVSLVEIRTWKWLYENPDASAEELKENVLKNAKDVWNEFYAKFLGEKDSPILAVYSHSIEYPLYLSNYPYGHIVEFQLESHFGDSKPGNEILRMYKAGRLTPDYWMKNAVKNAVSTKPLLEATSLAVKQIN